MKDSKFEIRDAKFQNQGFQIPKNDFKFQNQGFQLEIPEDQEAGRLPSRIACARLKKLWIQL